MKKRPRNLDDRTEKYWRKIEKIILHQNFRNNTLVWQGYDIALIKLASKNGNKVSGGKMLPACLPISGFDDKSNGSLFAAGYGWRRIPHCVTDTTGPEKFQVCGREYTCSETGATRCPLNFTDENGIYYFLSI